MGAYDVEVKNASRTNWVEGDLVITFSDIHNKEFKKYFILPKETSGRLLVVGGGGAGGQSKSYDKSKGLPGGGGAGGLFVNDSQVFQAAQYDVVVGAGGVAPRELVGRTGMNGADSSVSQGDSVVAKGIGGGGGGSYSTSAAQGGSGGGGSYTGKSANGGIASQKAPGMGNAGGKGGHAKYGAGGGGATKAGGATTSSSSGIGGAGYLSDITGVKIEYARGGDGGVPRVYSYYYYDDNGEMHLSDTTNKVYKTYWVEASDGKPGMNGRGEGGGGSGHYGEDSTYAGSGGSGTVIVRIPAYKIEKEDALTQIFDQDDASIKGNEISLKRDLVGPVCIPDNLGALTINLNGYSIVGAAGAIGDDITPGGVGESAIKIVPATLPCVAGVTQIKVEGVGRLVGGNGGDGHPQGQGAPAIGSSTIEVAPTVECENGITGSFIGQHTHSWIYSQQDAKTIVANCEAEGGSDCSYKVRPPKLVIETKDAEFSGENYDGLIVINELTAATGLPVKPVTYIGVGSTEYPETYTAPINPGLYVAKVEFRDFIITDTFTIYEPKPEQSTVYQSWKSALREGENVKIMLSATFARDCAINDGNVLFLGSRCNAHSMATGTVERSINSLARYANVRWYAFGSKDSETNLVNQLTRKGEKVPYDEKNGKIVNETVHLEGGNHFVYKEMMNALYAELVEKRNISEPYDLILLEFDGNLLCRDGDSPYQLTYELPDGWTEDKMSVLHAAMAEYYNQNRVVWIVPDVSKPKNDNGYTGTYPWKSDPSFPWQHAFLNTTEDEGYLNPIQKNYEDANALVAYLQQILIGGFFEKTTITDVVKDGLVIKSVTPQVRGADGFWVDMKTDDGVNYTINESHYDVEITAEVTISGQNVIVVFDTSAVQTKAFERGEVWGNDLRVRIDTQMNGFFTSQDLNEWKDTNEGFAKFEFEGSYLDDDFNITLTNPPPKLQNIRINPSYLAEDWVSIYDGEGHTITVKPITPSPNDVTIRYAFSEKGDYGSQLLITNVCNEVPVWFEIV
ncbi:MAG: hypothetical protein MJ139_03355, partial [Limosilactobacillus sp.]|nr:hypothetical protein [Limosilactobacillus sp.]